MPSRCYASASRSVSSGPEGRPRHALGAWLLAGTSAILALGCAAAEPTEEGEGVALVDASGASRVQVTAPAAYTSSGRPVTARLAAHGARLELSVDAADEAVLVARGFGGAGRQGSSPVGRTGGTRRDHAGMARAGDRRAGPTVS